MAGNAKSVTQKIAGGGNRAAAMTTRLAVDLKNLFLQGSAAYGFQIMSEYPDEWSRS